MRWTVYSMPSKGNRTQSENTLWPRTGRDSGKGLHLWCMKDIIGRSWEMWESHANHALTCSYCRNNNEVSIFRIILHECHNVLYLTFCQPGVSTVGWQWVYPKSPLFWSTQSHRAALSQMFLVAYSQEPPTLTSYW